MEKKLGGIQLTRYDYVEFGKNCDGLYYIALFLRNHTGKFNGRTFLTYNLYKSGLAAIKKSLKGIKAQQDDLFVDEEDCRKIEQVFEELRTE